LSEVHDQGFYILMKLYEKIPQGPGDWCELQDEQGNTYYLNKR